MGRSARQFGALRDLLVLHYQFPGDIRRVADDANVNLSHVPLEGPPRSIWHALLTEAEKQRKLQDLLGIVYKDYPDPRFSPAAWAPPDTPSAHPDTVAPEGLPSDSIVPESVTSGADGREAASLPTALVATAPAPPSADPVTGTTSLAEMNAPEPPPLVVSERAPQPSRRSLWRRALIHLPLATVSCASLVFILYDQFAFHRPHLSAPESQPLPSLAAQCLHLPDGGGCFRAALAHNPGSPAEADPAAIAEHHLLDCGRASGIGCFKAGEALYAGAGGIARDKKRAMDLFEEACNRGYGDGCDAIMRLADPPLRGDWLFKYSGSACFYGARNTDYCKRFTAICSDEGQRDDCLYYLDRICEPRELCESLKKLLRGSKG